jgi:hypothetical protein
MFAAMPGLVAWGNAPSRFRNRSIRNSPVMEQCSVLRDFNMNRFLPLISCVFVGILVSSCARNPPPTDQRPAPPIGRPNTIMSPLRKCHFAIRERRVRGTVDCSVPGTTLRPRTPRRPIWITSRQTPMPQHPPNRKTICEFRIGSFLSDPRRRQAAALLCLHEGIARRMKRSRYGDS